MTTVSLIGLNEVIRKLDSIDQMIRVVEPVLVDGMREMRDDARNQPPKRPGAFSSLATDGQRRAYWAKVNSGEALHGASGYIRSNRLRDSWEQPITEALNSGVRVILGSNAPYAQWVHSQITQQPFHKASQFPTDGQLIERHAKNIVQAVTRAVNKELNK